MIEGNSAYVLNRIGNKWATVFVNLVALEFVAYIALRNWFKIQ